MSFKFNFTGLTHIYAEALRRSDPTLVFELANGRGRFVFLMFFSPEDKQSKDRLFIYLRNTNVFLELKAYGSHKSGDFNVYIDAGDQGAIIEELQLGNGGQAFSFESFLESLNHQIPVALPLQLKLDKVREIWAHVDQYLGKVVDQADKIILMGIKNLPIGKKPQDKTLRKLYIYTNGSAQVITNLIASLRANRVTLAWTNRTDVAAKSLAEIMALINA